MNTNNLEIRVLLNVTLKNVTRFKLCTCVCDFTWLHL